MSGSVPKLSPPFNAAVLGDGGMQSPMWEAHHQELVDALAVLQQSLAQVNQGVTDGSDAAAGQLGEFLQASGSLALTNAAPTDVATLLLSAGDWDVSGSAIITPSAINVQLAQAWLSGAANTPSDPGRASLQSFASGLGTLGQSMLVVGPVRFSISAAATAHLGCQANFPSGTVTASGHLQARRAR